VPGTGRCHLSTFHSVRSILIRDAIKVHLFFIFLHKCHGPGTNDCNGNQYALIAEFFATSVANMFWRSSVIACLLTIGANAQPKSEADVYPSPWGSGGPGGWDEAYAKARDFVSKLTLLEKVNLTTGTGWEADRCVGTTGSVPRLNFSGLCLEDGPLGVRYGKFKSQLATLKGV
jgi:hypothetical protein